MGITTCVFDAYGTLFDVNAAARQAATEPGGEALAQAWPALAEAWRAKQLQYTWLRAITGAHTDFWDVTQNGLDWALEKTGLDGDAALRQRLLDLYWALPCYPEVPEVLRQIKASGQASAILSNGSPQMLEAAARSAKIETLLDEVLSVETVGVFKPSAAVYDLVGQRFDAERKEVLFVSSNGWDAAAAAGYGFEVAWVNRAAEPMDRLPWQPTHVLTDLTDIPRIAVR